MANDVVVDEPPQGEVVGLLGCIGSLLVLDGWVEQVGVLQERLLVLISVRGCLACPDAEVGNHLDFKLRVELRHCLDDVGKQDESIVIALAILKQLDDVSEEVTLWERLPFRKH